MAYKVFVDGSEGTTGLQIHDRLEGRKDLEVLTIAQEKRKDPSERSRLMNEADLVFLCLPDAAAKESVSLINNDTTRIIDASTAHRTADGWAYGIPELSATHRTSIKQSRRVANPGCHATGFILPVYPLVLKGIISPDILLTTFSITGYSGGGKKLIERYEATVPLKSGLESPNMYALGLKHKHLPEMQKVCGLSHPPLFTPIVSSFYQGMTVAVPIHADFLGKKLSPADIRDFLADYYKGSRFVKVIPFDSDSFLDEGFLGATACNGTNDAEIFVFGNEDQLVLATRLDNLGKGASGAAIQNMNIMFGFDEAEGL